LVAVDASSYFLGLRLAACAPPSPTFEAGGGGAGVPVEFTAEEQKKMIER
jgi:hypothetical protein